MKRYMIKGSVILSLLVLANSSLLAQSEKAQSRFSHKGVKVALGAGSYEMRAGEDLNERDWGLLSLGYGFHALAFAHRRRIPPKSCQRECRLVWRN